MSEIKSHEFEGFLQKSARHYRLFLIYGPDRGLVSERAAALAAHTGIDLSDPFAVTKLDIADLQKDHGRLIDEMQSIGLFGGDKLVWLRGAGNEKYVADAVAMLGQEKALSSHLIIEAGDLKKGAILRKTVEPIRSAMAIPCYSDDNRALNTLIDAELASSELRITPGARARLLELLGGDRIASRNEIRKLALYCQLDGLIEEHKVDEIVGDASAVSVDDAVDAVLLGDVDRFHMAMQRILSSKTSIFLVIQACLRQFQMLDVMKAEMEEKRLSVAQVMQSSGRHLNFRRKPAVEAALSRWNAAALAREANRLQSAILQTRKRPTLEESLALQTLLSTTLQSARSAQR